MADDRWLKRQMEEEEELVSGELGLSQFKKKPTTYTQKKLTKKATTHPPTLKHDCLKVCITYVRMISYSKPPNF